MSRLIEMLQHIKKMPRAYLPPHDGGRGSIHLLKAFILGFEMGQPTDEKTRDFDCFREWVGIYYQTLVDGQDGFTLILEHVDGDPFLAFDEFFRLLPIYLKDRQQLGFEGIHIRFNEIQAPLWEKFREEC
jgi:hypothetical protein